MLRWIATACHAAGTPFRLRSIESLVAVALQVKHGSWAPLCGGWNNAFALRE